MLVYVLGAVGLLLGAVWLLSILVGVFSVSGFFISLFESDTDKWRDAALLFVICIFSFSYLFGYLAFRERVEVKYSWEFYQEHSVSKYMGLSASGHHTTPGYVFLKDNGETMLVPAYSSTVNFGSVARVIEYKQKYTGYLRVLFLIGLDPESKYHIVIPVPN